MGTLKLFRPRREERKEDRKEKGEERKSREGRSNVMLVQHGVHIELKKSWAKSLLGQMGCVKRKCSNAGKVSLPHFKEIQENILPDIKAEVATNEVPPDLIFDWDQTALHLVSTGQWAMHHVAIRSFQSQIRSECKCQVTAAFAASLKGEFLAPQIIYKGKTE